MRSKRLRTSHVSEEAEASGSNVTLDASPSSTRTRRRIRSLRGYLKNLPEMPLDILFEVSWVLILREIALTPKLDMLPPQTLGYPEPCEDEQSIPRSTHEPYQCFILDCCSP